jgi:murein DD-endopeptidase MepM/ murein hydrolase activator NlpD
MTNYGQVTVPVAAESGVKAISAGPLQTMALKTDGTVLAWGQVFDGNNHVPAFVPPDLIGVTAIAAGYYHSAALKNNGTVVAWGNGSRGQTAVPAGLSNVTAIAVGYYHTVALKTDGTVVAWGDTQFSQTPAPAGMTGVVAIAAGDFHTLALVGDARWPGTLISLPNYSYDPEEGRQKITECRVNANGCFSLVFATHDTGAKCIISWTTTFHKWFPFFVFNANTVGSQIEEREPSGPVRFYRTTYLPHEVLPAEDFDYPMGNGGYDAGVDPVSADGIPEQITPERNTLYPSGPVGSPVREAVSPSTAWRNVQDVGAYYSVFGGLHPGEDWNNGSQSDADVGENVRAVANGQVVEIRSASVSGPSAGGYVMVIRHWLLNGDSVDSLYVHIAPDRNGGSANSGGLIGDESDFTYQVGAPVTKGSTIAVIGAVSAFSPHLHFEMRNKKLDVTGPLWPHSTGDAYYGPEVGSAGNRSPTISQADVEAAFGLMQADGIIDPSDFIDDHRP